MVRETTRRQALQMIGGALLIGFGGVPTSAQEDSEPLEANLRIEFIGQTEGWLGVEPEEIEDEGSPTLTLHDGESYEIGWVEGDGEPHYRAR